MKEAWREPESYQEKPSMGVKAKLGELEVVVGKPQLLLEQGIKVPAGEIGAYSGTVVYVGVDGKYAGAIVISDRLKAGAFSAVRQLNESGFKTVMLTGDNALAGRMVAEQLGISEYHTDLLPEDKVIWVEKLMRENHPQKKVIFVGDGINDAPVLARADIGIAMGGIGSEAAIEAADIVLMEDHPGKLLVALDIANYTQKIVWQNIVFALGIKGAFLLLGATGTITMWEAVFADVGVALLAILNATRARRYRTSI